jgi:hypothetical protein
MNEQQTHFHRLKTQRDQKPENLNRGSEGPDLKIITPVQLLRDGRAGSEFRLLANSKPA